MRTMNDKIQSTSHSSFVIVASVVCVRTVNDKIRWTSHSSFVIVVSVTCVQTVNGNFSVHNMLLITRANIKLASNANTPSTLAKLEGTRLEISIMPRGNEKRTCMIMISSYYRAVAAIFIACIYSILCWLLRRLFSDIAKGVHMPTL